MNRKTQPKSISIADIKQKFNIDWNNGKYQNMELSVNKYKSRKGMSKLSTTRKSIVHDVEVSGKSFNVKVDGVTDMIALSIGDHDRNEFEIPFLQSSLHPSIISIHSPKQQISIPSTYQDRWTERVIDDVHSISLIENTIDSLIRDGMTIDTIFVDVSDNYWDVVKELIPRYTETIRQYVVLTAESIKPAFKDVKEMKNMFRSSGYTYSRIGNELTVRVFMKEE